MRGGHEVHQPLVHGELAFAAQRVVGEQDLEATGRPTQLLLAVGLDGVWGVASRQLLRHEDRSPAALMEHQRGPDVFGLRAGEHAADVKYGVAAEEHVGADAERRVEGVAARLDEAVEHGLHETGAA